MSEFNFKIEDRLVLKNPTPQTALDIFKGTWISSMPVEYAQYTAGDTPLFWDTRVTDGEKFLGPMKDQFILDLGPLEGGIAYTLEKLGAKSVISVEANSILYLKCLIMKEILGMNKVQFLCGDVIEYLKNTSNDFDVCIASGILYHMINPIELLWLLSQKINKVLIWTHYFDEIDHTRNKIPNIREAVTQEFHGIKYNYHRQEYGIGFDTNMYCGGIAKFSNWMSQEGILLVLNTFGYKNINIIYDMDTISGPCMLLAASK